jgi:hypothetical protein
MLNLHHMSTALPLSAPSRLRVSRFDLGCRLQKASFAFAPPREPVRRSHLHHSVKPLRIEQPDRVASGAVKGKIGQDFSHHTGELEAMTGAR